MVFNMKHVVINSFKTLLVCIFVLSTKLSAQEINLGLCKQIKVAGPDEWNLNSQFDPKTQSRQGLGYEIFQNIAEKQQIPYQILHNIPWQRVLKYSEEGQVDLIVAIYKSDRRERFVQFSEPYFFNDIKIYVRHGQEFNFQTLKDLQGRKGLFPSGASYGDDFDAFIPNLDLVGKTSINELFMYLVRGAVDYAIQDSARAKSYITENQLGNDIVALPTSLLKVPLRFGYSRKSRCANLLEKFQVEYQRLITTGGINKLQNADL